MSSHTRYNNSCTGCSKTCTGYSNSLFKSYRSLAKVKTKDRGGKIAKDETQPGNSTSSELSRFEYEENEQ